jgi:hypothetical protein
MTRKELTIKQIDFGSLLSRERFLRDYFNARLRYRIRMYHCLLLSLSRRADNCLSCLASINNGLIYVEVLCKDQTISEHTEVGDRKCFVDGRTCRSLF